MGAVSNVLMKPVDHRLTIEQRFDGEWRRSIETIRVSKLAQWKVIGAAFLVTGLAIVGVVSLPPVAGQILFMVIIANAILFNLYQGYSRNIQLDRERLGGPIFEELLIAPSSADGSRSITSEKIKVFEKWGGECRVLRIGKHMAVSGEIIKVFPTVRVSEFCEWAINYIQRQAKIQKEDLNKEGSENPNIHTIKLLQQVKVRWGHLLIANDLIDPQEGTLLHAVRKINEYVNKISSLESLPKPQEGEPEPVRKKEEEDIRKSNAEIMKKATEMAKEVLDAFKWTFASTLSIPDLATVISHCPRLHSIKLSEEFLTKGVFASCEGERQEEVCNRHRPIAVELRDRVVAPCSLFTLSRQWEDNYIITHGLIARQ